MRTDLRASVRNGDLVVRQGGAANRAKEWGPNAETMANLQPVANRLERGLFPAFGALPVTDVKRGGRVRPEVAHRQSRTDAGVHAPADRHHHLCCLIVHSNSGL